MDENMKSSEPSVGLVGQPVQVPTVGRIVHFYTKDTNKHFNGQGDGPYPALVAQVFDKSGMANLKVFPPFGEPYDEGSVSHRIDAERQGQGRWWDWAPRVANSIELYGEGVPQETARGSGGEETAPPA